MRLRLFPKIALILILLATVPALIVGWQTASLNRRHLENNILELHTNLVNSMVRRTDYYLDGIFGMARTFVENIRMQGLASSAPFQAFLDAHEEFVSLSYLDAKGEEMLKAARSLRPETRTLKNVSRHPVYRAFQEQAAQGNVGPQYGFFSDQGDPELVFLFPYHPDSPRQGALWMVVSLRTLWNDIGREGAGVGGGGRTAFLVDRQGRLLLHTDAALQSRIESGTSPILLDHHPLVQQGLQQKSIGSKEYADDQGNAVIGAYAPVRWTGWLAVTEQPKESAYWAIRQSRRRALGIVWVALVIAGVLAFFMAKNLSRPVLDLIRGARRVSGGDFSGTVAVTTRDELGDLTATFNQMIQELDRYNALQVDRILEEKTKTESVLFSIGEGMVLTDRDGRIQLFNRPAARFLRAAGSADSFPGAPGLEGRSFPELIENREARAAIETLLQAPDAKKEVWLEEGGRPLCLELAATPVHVQESGRRLGLVTVIRDVTPEKQMERMKENFLHSITHDLRNPMTSVMGFIRFLLEGTPGPINDSQKKMLQTMERAGSRLLAMINDILDIAKFEAGKLDADLAVVNVRQLAEDVHNLYRGMAERKQVHLEVRLPPPRPDPFTLVADERQLERVIGNLISNAIKFSPSDKAVTLEVTEEPDGVRFAVQDQGHGIPAHYLDTIFDKFQQVKGASQGGTGLGLTISRYFVELHQGKIWVESELGKGSQFMFWIPKNLVPARKNPPDPS